MKPISLRSAAPHAWWAGAGAACFASWLAAEYYVPEAIAIGISAVALAAAAYVTAASQHRQSRGAMVVGAVWFLAVWATAGVLHMMNDVTPYALVGGAAAIAFVGGGAIAFDALRARDQTRPLLRSVPHAVLWSLAFGGSFRAAVILAYLVGSQPVSDTHAGALLAVASCGAFGGALASALTLPLLGRTSDGLT